MSGDLILTLNAGSSSIKVAVYPADGVSSPVASGKAVGIGSAEPHLTIRDGCGATLLARTYPAGADETAILRDLMAWIEGTVAHGKLVAAGHRIAHGGARFRAPSVLTPEVVDALAALTPLAPLHEPHNLEPVRILAREFPNLPQIGCFDTAFHTSNDTLATTFPIARDLTAEGLRRYGFHGLSYEYIAGRLPEYLGPIAEGRVIVAHLGNGASMCAMRGRRSVASTMGLTALDGLMMGTRCGSIDPGLVLHLIEERGMAADAVSDLLYRRSGLLGVSGISNDMGVLLASDAPEAAEAVALFVYRITRELGSLVAALGGLDALVFTAGIGENAAPVREAVCRQAAWLGLIPDPAANADHGPRITAAESRVHAYVIPTDEEQVIARHCRELLPSPTDMTSTIQGGEGTG